MLSYSNELIADNFTDVGGRFAFPALLLDKLVAIQSVGALENECVVKYTESTTVRYFNQIYLDFAAIDGGLFHLLS